MTEITRVLSAIEQGDPHAAERLLPLVYDELRRLAAQKLAHEQPGQTLDATALVHEAYLRLVRPDDGQAFDGRRHFFAAAAAAMRRILIERARQKQRLIHGGGRRREELHPDLVAAPEPNDELLALDAALVKLAERDPVKARLVELRYFAGLTGDQAAEILGISTSTADRHWVYARAWLRREVQARPKIIVEILGAADAVPSHGVVEPRRTCRRTAMNEETLFHEALAKPAAERAAFLEQACAGRSQLRAAVEALLAAHEASGSLLDKPAVEVGETTDSAPAPQRPVATIDHHPEVAPGLVIAGRYTLVEKIGEGGMGEVWVAKQTEPVKRRVALKLIKTGMDSRAVLARFEQERQALALMDHPNIARVLDGGLTPDGRPFFVMELVNGLPLTRFCDEARLTTRERLELFVPICQAVQHAHHKGIVHRDLKPANILVTLIDGRGVPKVIDFGVAKATAGKLTDESLSTQFGAVVGTLEYMSPEQAGFSGEDIDTRADVYSLGVVLYELLTGLRPIDARRLKKSALAEMIRIIQEEEPARPSTRLSTDEALASLAALRQTEPRKLTALLRGELDWVVMKCLEKRRDRRYETANGLARDVQRYLADELVEARPPSVGYQLGKFLKRHKGPVLAAAAVLLALLAGITGTANGLVRAEQGRHAAEQARADEARQRGLAEENEREARAEKENAVKAAAAETAALAQTRRRLGQIEKGVDLLASLLAGINPRNEEKGGPALYEQLRERASKAADQLDAESVGDAQAVARLQTILGSTLRELGDYPKAITVLEKACTTLERELGDDHPDTLACRNNLANAYQAAGKLDLAIPLLERTLKAEEAKLGDDHPDTLISRNNLANAYQAAGKPDLAIPLFERTLKAFEAKLGDDHPDTLASRGNLAVAYAVAGKPDLAIPLLERTLKAFETKLGDDHPNTLSSRNNLAGAYAAAGKLDLAIPLLEETLRLQKAKLGPDHPQTLVSMRNLESLRNLSTAQERYRVQLAKNGPGHIDTLLGTATWPSFTWA